MSSVASRETQFLTREIRLHGHSMYPALKNQDILTVDFFKKPRSIESFFEGEVLLLRQDRGWVIHRVVKLNNKLVAKGDWSLNIDDLGSAWGRVVEVNGLESYVLKDPKLSKYSLQLTEKKRWRRRLNRLRLVCYVTRRNLLKIL